MIKAVISNGDVSHQIELEGSKEDALVGTEIGEEIEGSKLGLTGYILEVSGGSDKAGVPMRKDLEGQGRGELLLSGGEGFNPSRDGERRRKSIHGRTVSRDIVQVNLVVTGEGEEPLQELTAES